MKKKVFIMIIAVILLLGTSIYASKSIEAFTSLELKVIILILVNCLLYIGLGMILFRLIKKAKKDKD